MACERARSASQESATSSSSTSACLLRRKEGRTHLHDLVAVLTGRLAVGDDDGKDGLAERVGASGGDERVQDFLLERLRHTR